jgi:cytochrome c peroxidase
MPTAAKNVLAGERLFFSSDSSGLAMYQWISCASCHLEGGHDGRTWFFENGPRNTPALHAMVATAPFHWAGERPSLLDFQETIQELQGGTGLSKDKLQQLADFMATLEVPDSPFAEPDGGREVFEAQGCATCHVGDAFVDGMQHDVGSGDDPAELLGPAFDTPTLHGLWNSAPYYHDGSMPSLADVLAPGRPADPHSIELPAEDLQVLLDYLNAQ